MRTRCLLQQIDYLLANATNFMFTVSYRMLSCNKNLIFWKCLSETCDRHILCSKRNCNINSEDKTYQTISTESYVVEPKEATEWLEFLRFQGPSILTVVPSLPINTAHAASFHFLRNS
jgi:hypothetical protein